MVLGETEHLKSEDFLSARLTFKFAAQYARFRLLSEGRVSTRPKGKLKNEGAFSP
jgi:hypothetical protein